MYIFKKQFSSEHPSSTHVKKYVSFLFLVFKLSLK